MLERIEPCQKRHLLPLHCQLLHLLQPPHQLLHPDDFVWHRMRSFTTLLIPVRDFHCCLFHPLNFSHRLFSLPPERPDPSGGRGLRTSGGSLLGGEKTPTRHRTKTPTTPSPWAWLNKLGIFYHSVRILFAQYFSSSLCIFPSTWHDQAVTDPAARQSSTLQTFFALDTLLPFALGGLSPLPSAWALR